MNNLNFKTMRKIAFTLLMFLTVSLYAQDKDVVKFMGIPIDGSKSEMISQLKKKGFIYNLEYEWLEGKFNGEQVNVIVHTNNDLVDRIMVVTANPVNETNIKIKFNNLVRQFNNNERYYSSEEDQEIGDNVDISYEMSVNSKRFEASFHQKHSKEEEQVMKQNMYDNYDAMIEQLLENDELKDFAEEIRKGDKESNIDSFFALIEFEYLMQNDVWFIISESAIRYNYYNINIYYDNLRNRPNGEDL